MPALRWKDLTDDQLRKLVKDIQAHLDRPKPVAFVNVEVQWVRQFGKGNFGRSMVGCRNLTQYIPGVATVDNIVVDERMGQWTTARLGLSDVNAFLAWTGGIGDFERKTSNNTLVRGSLKLCS